MTDAMGNPTRGRGSLFFHQTIFDNAPVVNRRICAGFNALRHDRSNRHSHYFAGRFENIYISRDKIPELDGLLDVAEEFAREILGQRSGPLGQGFWFNEMGPGHATLPHSHDDDDELLSGVYYLRVPRHSGNLILMDGSLRGVIRPQEGMFVFFRPDVLHEETENKSQETRLSLAFNVGPPRRDS